MGAPALASLSDLSARGVDTSDASRAQAAIEDVSNLIHHYTNSAWVDDDTGELVATVPGIAKTICCNAVQRMLRNPLGLTQQNESAGPFSQGFQFADSSADAYLRRNEIDQLRRAAGAPSGLSSIQTTRGTVEMSTRPSFVDDAEFDVT